MDQFILFGVFHLSVLMECWESLITTIRQLEVQIMRQFQQSQQLHMPWTCDYGFGFGRILGREVVGTLSSSDTTDMLYVQHSILISAERLLFENCLGQVVPLSPLYLIILAGSDRNAMLTCISKCTLLSLILTVMPRLANV